MSKRERYLTALCWAFVFFWALDEKLPPEGDVVIPIVRWLITLGSLYLITKKNYIKAENVWTISMFLWALGVALVFADSFLASVPVYMRLVGAGILSIHAGSLGLRGRKNVTNVVLSACISMVFASLIVGILFPELGIRVIGLDRPRLYGLASHPAYLGYFGSIIGSVFGARVLLIEQRLPARALNASVCAVGWIVVLMADSRTGEIASMLALLVTLSVSLVTSRRRQCRHPKVLAVVFGTLTTALVLLPTFVAIGITHFEAASDKYSLSTESRIAIWQGGLIDFGDHVIFGNGIGTRLFYGDTDDDADGLLYYHNAFINYLAKTGVVGALPMMIMLFYAPYSCVFFATRLAKKDAVSEEEKIIQIFSLSACIATIVFATTEAALQNLYPSFLIYFLTISLTSGSRKAKLPRLYSIVKNRQHKENNIVRNTTSIVVETRRI